MRQYYIEWDDHKLRFLIPDNRIETEIAISDIGSVNIAHSEINIQLMNGNNNAILLKDIQTKELNQIKHKFHKIGELCATY